MSGTFPLKRLSVKFAGTHPRKGVRQKAKCNPHAGDESTRNERAECACHVRLGRIERHCITQMLSPYQFMHKRLATRVVDDVNNAERRRKKEEHPDLYEIGIDQK